MAIEAINPATGEFIARYDPLSAEAVARIVSDAHAAFLEWRRASFAERARPMRNVAAILREEAGAALCNEKRTCHDYRKEGCPYRHGTCQPGTGHGRSVQGCE